MSKEKSLQGGLNDNGSKKVLEEVRDRVVDRKKVSLSFLETGVVVRAEDGRIDAVKLANRVNDVANKVFKWILDVARPFLRKLDQMVREIGKEILDDLCDDASQTNRQRKEDYEEAIEFLSVYSLENDEANKDVEEELKTFSERRTFFEKMFSRISDATRLGLLVDDLAEAEDKKELEDLLADNKVFLLLPEGQEGPIRAFGRGYNLAEETFGFHHDFAVEELAKVVNPRAREITVAYIKQQKQREQEIAAEKSEISARELFLGDADDVNEKSLWMTWWYEGHLLNGLRVQRVRVKDEDRIYILDAQGKKLVEELEAMRKRRSKPYILLKHILAEDGEHLCPGRIVKGKPHYDFKEFVPEVAMTIWVRRAAGVCIPDRLLEDDETWAIAHALKSKNANGGKKKQFVKPPGEIMTDFEFLCWKGLGKYDLVFDPGFHYQPRDEEGNPLAGNFKITKHAIARLERKLVGVEPKISLNAVSSEELVRLLEAGGAVVGREYFEGERSKDLPKPLSLGIGQAFKRFKLSGS